MSIWDLTEEDKGNMRRAGWSDQAIGYFAAKENLGELEGADVCHTARTDVGEAVRFCIHVVEGRIVSAKYSYQGCPALAATCAAVTEFILNKTIDEAESATATNIWEMLVGLPEGHDKDVTFALGTFKEAVKIYRDQKRLTKAQHDAYTHICGLTGRQLDELDTIPCGECPWIQNCENDHVIV